MKKLLVLTSTLLLIGCANELKPEHTKNNMVDPFSPEEFIGEHRTKVSVLGMFHFSNPGLDDYKHKFPFDILSQERQKQLAQLLDALEEFRPTKILVENPRITNDSVLNKAYQEFLKADFDISERTSETYQIGFKLAKRLGHSKIYASDTERLKWFGADIDDSTYDEEAYLRSLDQYKKFKRYDYQSKSRFEDSLKSVLPLKNYLRFLNTPSNRLKNHQGYLTEWAVIGAGDLYNGADATARWYQRNLRIFANAYDITDLSKEERMLLIYGSGHVWTLRQLFKDSPDFEYIEINKYLNEN
ncbi:DUF5694 domain-containing protein [uncultured Croceitalea sp.]|uniref:DUF5694 domain-containing protein n=1 Tax=uncultured Croceitalea sp. TaxID=1798908 RepID=UPI0033063A27